TFGNMKMEFFVAPENMIYFRITADKAPEVSLRLPDTCKSTNFIFSDAPAECRVRKFTGDDVTLETAVAVSLYELDSCEADEASISTFCVAVVSSFDDESYAEKSIEMALAGSYDSAKLRTQEKWQKFFSASRVTLEDKEIESFYNSSLYHLAGCMGNAQFPPGLFGNFITDDFFPWAGDYHMNYNYEAPYYCVFASNHPELFEGYMAPIHDMKKEAARCAKLLGSKGYAFPVSFGPKGLDVYSMKSCKEHGILFLGQKSHAAYACVIPLMHWFSTYDKDYARENYYDFIVKVAEFWENYLVKEKGRYVIKNDAAHEIPYYRGEKFRYITHKGQIEAVNAINSLGLVKMLFNGVYDMAKELGLDSKKYPLWEDIIKNLSDFPIFIKKGKRCFRYSDRGIRWRDENTVGLQHIYPASQIGLNSGKELLKIAKNTYFINDRRLDDNGSNSYLPAGARIGVDPAFLIEGIHQNIKEFAMPNRMFRHHGGGIEHLTTVPATINEMLLQSHEGIIRLFPCWDINSDASFENLRADGAFLVSASLENKRLASLRITSLQGRPCTVEYGRKLTVIRMSDYTKIPCTQNGGTATFETQADETYILI
ncbi:MAG: hypothetical protein IKV49_04275, partial [Clostridia bacterium]|nr:hypothetical protein [Clostridia bacterium]